MLTINAIANPTGNEKGERYLGTVKFDHGSFSLLPGKEALLHISKMRPLSGDSELRMWRTC